MHWRHLPLPDRGAQPSEELGSQVSELNGDRRRDVIAVE
jgi:hypothetical protein